MCVASCASDPLAASPSRGPALTFAPSRSPLQQLCRVVVRHRHRPGSLVGLPGPCRKNPDRRRASALQLCSRSLHRRITDEHSLPLFPPSGLRHRQLVRDPPAPVGTVGASQLAASLCSSAVPTADTWAARCLPSAGLPRLGKDVLGLPDVVRRRRPVALRACPRGLDARLAHGGGRRRARGAQRAAGHHPRRAGQRPRPAAWRAGQGLDLWQAVQARRMGRLCQGSLLPACAPACPLSLALTASPRTQDLDALLRGNGSAIYTSELLPATTPADEEGSTAYSNPAVECSDSVPYPANLTDADVAQMIADENAWEAKHVSRHFAASGVTACPRWGNMREPERVRLPAPSRPCSRAADGVLSPSLARSTLAPGTTTCPTASSSSATRPTRSRRSSTPGRRTSSSPSPS